MKGKASDITTLSVWCLSRSLCFRPRENLFHLNTQKKQGGNQYRVKALFGNLRKEIQQTYKLYGGLRTEKEKIP